MCREFEFGNENSMKRLFAFAAQPALARLQWPVDIALVAAIGFAVMQAAQAFKTPSQSDISSATPQARQAYSFGRKIPGEDDMAKLFFRSLDKSDSRSAPKADSGNIKLFGVRPGVNGMGSAILSANGSAQEVYRSGQQFDNGAVLTAVYANRIEISRQGDVRSVYLLGRDQRQKRRLIEGAPSETVAQKAKPEKPKIKTLTSLSLIEALDLNAADNGMRVGDGAHPLVLMASNLLRGDIITAVNGKPIKDSTAMAGVAAAVKAGAPVAVELIRGKRTLSKSINTKALHMAQMDQ